MFTIGSFTLTDEEVTRRKRYLEITEDDESRIRTVHSHLTEFAPEISQRFYDYLLAHQHTRDILSAPGMIERLRQLQSRYFEEMTSGRYDLEYFENRLRVGQVHERIGLAPEWYLGAYNKYLQIVSEVLLRAFEGLPETYVQTMASLTKIVYLDMGLALDAYMLAAQQRLAEKNEELDRQNQELKRLEAAKQQLSDMIVHDLQNPLAGIIAFLDLLHATPERLDESELGALDEALRRCHDLVDMILNVLQVSRAETGSLHTDLGLVNVSAVAREGAAAFRLVAEQDGRGLAIEAPPSLTVRTDEKLVRRILYNLLRNALRHTPKGTSVVVRVERGGANTVRLSVADDGPGVPVAVQTYLFDRLGASALRNAGLRVDSGLGLAFCKTAADALGAGLTVFSDGHHGTTFTLELR
jgi:signal transduction histidine kinase